MIYTFGHAESYDAALADRAAANQRLLKVGRGWTDGGGYVAFYPGGSVWRTLEEVQRYLDRNQPRLADFKPYGVEADWDRDTAENVDGYPWHDLLHDRPVTQLAA